LSLNAAESTSRDMFVSGRNFKPGERGDLGRPNQRQWRVGDLINDVTGIPAPLGRRSSSHSYDD
jgi:hypothetical protein